MGSFSIWHWGIVLLVVLVVFGTAKLRNLGGDLGASLKGFKDAMKEGEETDGKKDAAGLESKKETIVETVKKNDHEDA